MSSSTSGPALREAYAADSAKIQKAFEATGNGRVAIEERSALTDRITSELFLDFIGKGSPEVSKLALVAVAGYGRRALFPHSDVDLLFLCEDAAAESLYKDAAREMCQELWDMRLRMSPTTRTLAECGKFNAENPEFSISLFDCRFVAGSAQLFSKLNERILPQLFSRHRDDLRRNLAELTRQRHAKYGDTIFHLEPNLKNSPGALRDYHVVCWLKQLTEMSGGTAQPPVKWRE
jgi:[protein-PII] uridylyltransferase